MSRSRSRSRSRSIGAGVCVGASLYVLGKDKQYIQASARLVYSHELKAFKLDDDHAAYLIDAGVNAKTF
eukprot:1365349-Pyramimonas_sp.AAC.1